MSLQDNEDTLIKKLRKGSEKAYEELYIRYYEVLVIYCLKLTGKLPLAEDIVQNTFIKLWINRSKITIKSSLKNYLYRSVYNEFATEYGKKQREEEVLKKLKYEVLSHITNLDNDELERKKKLLKSAIETLPKKCKTVFLLQKIQGYSQKEIASHLNISEKAVEKHISRAMIKIKKKIAQKKQNLIYFFLRNISLRQKHFAVI